MKFKYSVSYRSYLVPELSGVRKPVVDKKGDTRGDNCIYDQEKNRRNISLKINGIDQVST